MIEQLSAGVARQVISPPPGITLIGYGDRAKGNRGVHDDLTATALVLAAGEQRLALLACDLLCLNEFIVDRVRAAVGLETPVLVCCSHTHSGPVGYADERSSRPRRLYIDGLVEKLALAVQQAGENLVPARLEYAAAQAEIAVNRREHTASGEVIIGENPGGVVDRTLQVVSVLRQTASQAKPVQETSPSPQAQGQARLATLVNFACHGTVLGPDNRLASADWIGSMRARLEAELGGLVLFLQGATADLNPRMGWGKAEVWEMLRVQGEQVAQAALGELAKDGSPLAGTPLGLLRREVWLPFEAYVRSAKPPTVYRKRILKMGGLPSFLWPLTDSLLNQRYPWRSRLEPGSGEWAGRWTTPLRITAARLGELALVTFGSETFTEIGLQIKAASPATQTLFASVTDGCIGYLTTPEAHAEGGYEVDTAPYAYRFPGRLAPQSADLALQAAREMLAQLFAPHTQAAEASLEKEGST